MLVLDKCVLFSIPPCKYFFFRASGKFSRTGSFPSGLVLEVELIGSFNTWDVKLVFAYLLYSLNSDAILYV